MNKYLDNIHDCTLGIFSKVYNTHNYKHLFIITETDEKEIEKAWQKYNEEEAKQAWLKLFDEYSDTIESNGVNYLFETTKNIESKKSDYLVIKNCLHFIRIYNELNIIGNIAKEVGGLDYEFEDVGLKDVVKQLNKYNFNFNIERGIPNELERVEKQSSRILGKIEKDIEKLEKRKDDNYVFEDTITAVSKFMSYRIPDSDSVRMFVSNLNMLIKHNKAQQDAK
jgi:hypothetical protein